MSPSRFSVDRPIAISMIYVSLALLGLVALTGLPVDLMPNTSSNVVTIIVGIRGGLPPEDVEMLVTKPIEEAMGTLANLEEVQSVSKKERAVVTLSFKPGSNISDATLDVSERLSKIKGKLPKEIEKPVVAHYQENDEPILIMALTSTHQTPESMRDLVENNLKPQLTRVPGVANVEIGGGRERKILVEFDKEKLEAHRLSILEVINALGANNLNLLSGKIEKGRDTYLIRTMGSFETLDDMRELGVAVTKEGSRIRLRDIGTVRDYYLEPESYAHFNGQPTVSVYVQKETQANTVRVAGKVEDVVSEFRRRLPGDIQLTITTNQAVFIKSQIKVVGHAILHGAFLTALVIWLFLKDWKHTLAVFVAIPTSILITFAAMYVRSLLSKNIVSLNVRALQGLALGIGRMVDDSIVVLCNIMDKKKLAAQTGTPVDVKELCVGATKQMSLAIASSTLTTIVVFAPLDFVSEEVRMEYSDLAFTVVVALLSSLLVSITLVPLVCSRIPIGEKIANPVSLGDYAKSMGSKLVKNLKSSRFWPPHLNPGTPLYDHPSGGAFPCSPLPDRRGEENKRERFDQRGIKSPLPIEGEGKGEGGRWKGFAVSYFRDVGLEWKGYYHGFQRRFGSRGLFGSYRYLVSWCVRRRGWVLAGVFCCFLASLSIYWFGLEKEFAGNTEQDEFIVFVELPAGAKLDISNQVVSELEKLINAVPEVQKAVKSMASRVEGWSSKIYVTLTPELKRARSVQDVIDELRPKVGKIGAQYDAFVYFSEPQSSKEVAVDVFGLEPGKLRDLAVNIAGRVEKVPGLADVKLRYKPGRPEVRLIVDKMRAASFGFSVRDIADNLHAMMRGLRATYFSTGNQQVETVARLSQEDRRTLDDVHKLTLVTRKGELVSIDQLMKFDLTLAPSEVYRKNKERYIEVSANRGRVALGTAVSRVSEVLHGLQVPVGYHYEFTGDYKKMRRSEKQFAFAFAAAIGLVYTILACFFESYSQPLIILLTVPLATIGTMPTLWVTGTAVNMGVYIGLLMLGGIVVSNAIILIDRLNETCKAHKSLLPTGGEGQDEGESRSTVGPLTRTLSPGGERGTHGGTFSLFRSVLKVGQERFEPIMMTSITTILGLAPMAFQKGEASELWRPLAITVISGLGFSTVLTLVVIPCCYVVLVDAQLFTARIREGKENLSDVVSRIFKNFWKLSSAKPRVEVPRPVPAFLRNRHV